MRKAWIALLGIALVGLTVVAAPRLDVGPGVYDFGEAAEGLLLIHAFILRNTGTSPLTFTQQPTTTCGCVQVVPLARMSLAPGETISLGIRVDTTGYGGRGVNQPVFVYSNDPAAPQLTLTVQGSVRPSLPYAGSAATLEHGFYLLVDLRPPEAFAQGRLLGAINIPFAALPDWLPRLPKDYPIFLYDETGAQAIQAAQLLRQNGFLSAFAINGGLVGWWREVGDLFFTWAPGAARTPPAGTMVTGAFTLPASRIVSQGYQVILDLRPREAHARGSFPGSINLKLEEVPDFAASIPRGAALPSGYRVSIWCVDEDGSLALQAAQYLYALGFSHARALIGGLPQWRLRYGDVLLWPETIR
jgi:rhodanese-related sulfurtransferase